jgi:hypothetical protein
VSDKCKEQVRGVVGFGSHRCYRKAVKDGYCKQHHPDTVAQRRNESVDDEAQHLDRRERIATAVLAGFMSSDAKFPRDRPPNFVGIAVAVADALIAELDKEVQP